LVACLFSDERALGEHNNNYSLTTFSNHNILDVHITGETHATEPIFISSPQTSIHSCHT